VPPLVAVFAPLEPTRYRVTSSADSGPGSLREALAADRPGARVIEIGLEVSAPIVLESSLVYSSPDPVSIIGEGERNLIQGSVPERSALFHATAGADLTLHNLEFATAPGPVIRVDSPLTQGDGHDRSQAGGGRTRG
jgi:hypothetical protein